MAIGTPALAVANPTGGTTSVTTASFTPPANSTLFALIGSKGSSVTGPPSISDSLGGTWTKVTDANDTTDTVHIYSSLYAQTVGASPAAMTVSATGGTTATICSVISITGIGTDFTNVGTNANSAGDPSVTLGTTPASTSIVLGWAQGHLTNAFTQSTGTELFDSTLATNYRVEFAYTGTSPGSTLGWTSTNTSSVGIALEVKIPSAGGSTGTASGTIDLGGAATGAVKAHGTASGTLALSGSGTATIALHGASSGGLGLSGAATGTAGTSGRTGTALGALGIAGSSAAMVRVTGTANDNFAFAGSAALVVVPFPTLPAIPSGWTKVAARSPVWGASASSEGTVWAPVSKSAPKWGAGDGQSGTTWTAKPKGNATW